MTIENQQLSKETNWRARISQDESHYVNLAGEQYIGFISCQMGHEMVDRIEELSGLQWVKIDDADPMSVPQEIGHYLVACEGGNVTESLYFTNLEYYRGKQPGRKRNGKYSRRFEVAQRGYKITHWMLKPKHPDHE